MITEVMYDPPQSGVDSAYEWLELHSATDHTIDLVGWTIDDSESTDPIPSLSLPAGQCVVVAATENGFWENYPAFAGAVVFIADGRIGNGLSNEGEVLRLRDGQGRTIDVLSYGPQRYPSTLITGSKSQLVAAGHSLERISLAYIRDNPDPSPGYSPPFPSPTPEATPSPTPTTSATVTLPPASPMPTPSVALPTPTQPALLPPPTATPTPLPTQPPTGDAIAPLAAALALAGILVAQAGLWLRRR